MDSFRERRHTIILALVAIGISVGILTWSIVTIADLNSSGPGLYASGRPATLASTSARQESNGSAKSDFGGTDINALMADAFAKRMSETLMPGQADPKLAGWEHDLDWLRAQSLQSVGPGVDQVPAWQSAGLSVSPALTAPTAAPASPAPTAAPAPPASTPSPVASASPVDADPQTVAGTPPRATAHIVRDPISREPKPESARAAAPKPHRIASRGTFTEKTVEQGDSGSVSFRYRRRTCTPGNMVDVCYMPAADRQRIVIERY